MTAEEKKVIGNWSDPFAGSRGSCEFNLEQIAEDVGRYERDEDGRYVVLPINQARKICKFILGSVPCNEWGTVDDAFRKNSKLFVLWTAEKEKVGK